MDALLEYSGPILGGLLILIFIIIKVLFIGDKTIDCDSCGKICYYPKSEYRKKKKEIESGSVKIYCKDCSSRIKK